VKFLVTVGMKIESCQTIVFCYAFPMTTNDLITLITEEHNNADSLAQLAMAIECLQEATERMQNQKSFHSELNEVVTKIRDKHDGYAYVAGSLIGAIRCNVYNKQTQKEILNTLETVLSY
jgi:hypothetical protein